MKKVKLPGNDTPVSRIIAGGMILNLEDYAGSVAMLEIAVSLGINSIDLAYVYGGGDCERMLGRWMEESGSRKEFYVITKGAHPDDKGSKVTPEGITSDLMESLERLRTDYIDAYFLHRDDESKPVGPIMDTLHEHCKAGRIRAFGGSNWTHTRVAEANAYAAAKGQFTMTVNSPNYSLCEQLDDPWGGGCITIGGKPGAQSREFYLKEDISIFSYSSLGRGMLSGRVTRENYKELLDDVALKGYAYDINFDRVERARELAVKKGVTVAQIGLAFLLNQPLRVFPIVGAETEEELRSAAAALDIVLTKEECAWLDNGPDNK